MYVDAYITIYPNIVIVIIILIMITCCVYVLMNLPAKIEFSILRRAVRFRGFIFPHVSVIPFC